MVTKAKSPLFKVTQVVEENIEEDKISNPTIPQNNIVNECFAVDVEEISINN